MGAGDGAAEQAKRTAERVQRLKRRLDQAEHATKAWDEGAVGEQIVAERLGTLVPHGWFLLHDMHWPGRPKANLDHVLVGPGGVIVVDAKNWTGEVSVASGVLWQGRFARTQSVECALAQCAAVASVMAPRHRRFVRPLICLAGQPDLFGITSSDVAVAGSDRVVAAVLALPTVLDEQDVATLHARLGEELMQEPVAESPVVRALTSKPAGPPRVAQPPGTPGRQSRQTRAAGRSAVDGPAPGNGPAPGRPGPRNFGPRVGRTAGAGTGSTGHGAGYGAGRKSRAQQQATSMTHLMFLAAFVVFAVYVLPYWGG
ncbi:nuclease-related domain-containing protein [Arthrobacter sp. HMWF013]|uniref:nuclease-related domain-containing protein n=1 Tax=Arthrobacter sp. HMWF013 TaxID=2056849 RepID=UPI000D3AFEE9|nr:nuclease-related domain-containing protein [Arthrobacter sp. HMWF013]PTT60724.1 NERD nuclease [Arthrobacter sp. HMWF013]